MGRSVVGLCIGIILVALGFSLLLPGLIGTFGGITLGILATIGALFLGGFIPLVVFSGVGLLISGVIGLIGVIFLGIALPFLIPLLVVIVPVVILIKLVS